jgi:hypothetical protein
MDDSNNCNRRETATKMLLLANGGKLKRQCDWLGYLAMIDETDSSNAGLSHG